jgi:hypothetical protein
MNGKQAKSLRKAIEYEKSPADLDGGGLFEKDEALYFKRASNPKANVYRKIKARFTRGW